jgi:predicted RNase H-like HicB family nuclease
MGGVSKMTYRYRYPLSRFFARFGVTLVIRIDVLKDDEADVYVATSQDIPGLVIEAQSFSKLRDEVTEAIPNLLFLEDNSNHHHAAADVIYKDHIAIA